MFYIYSVFSFIGEFLFNQPSLNSFIIHLRLLLSLTPYQTVLDKLTALYAIGRRAFESQPVESKWEH